MRACLGDSTQNFMGRDSLIIYRCQEMSNQNEFFNRCAMGSKQLNSKHEVHNCGWKGKSTTCTPAMSAMKGK